VRAVSSSSPSAKHISPGHPVTIQAVRPHAHVAAGVSVYAWFDPLRTPDNLSSSSRLPQNDDRPRMERIRKIRFDIAGDIFARVDDRTTGTVTTFGRLQDLVRRSEYLFVKPAAVDLLARRDHSRQELIRKLIRKGFSRAAGTQAVDELQSQGYQDDLRAAESWVRSAMYGSGRSRAYVLAGLAKRGYDRDIAARAVLAYEAEHPCGFDDALKSQIEKTVRAVVDTNGVTDMTVDQRHTVLSRLLRRGFSMKEIQQHFR